MIATDLNLEQNIHTFKTLTFRKLTTVRNEMYKIKMNCVSASKQSKNLNQNKGKIRDRIAPKFIDL